MADTTGVTFDRELYDVLKARAGSVDLTAATFVRALCWGAIRSGQAETLVMKGLEPGSPHGTVRKPQRSTLPRKIDWVKTPDPRYQRASRWVYGDWVLSYYGSEFSGKDSGWRLTGPRGIDFGRIKRMEAIREASLMVIEWEDEQVEPKRLD